MGKTYLPLASREVPQDPLTRAKDRDPFIAPIHQVLLELVGRAQGGDSANAQIASVNRRSRKVRNILRTLDRSRAPLVLLGEPGSGKTMTLQQAAMTLALRESQRRSPRAVLYVRLGEFHVERSGRIGAEDVLHYLEQASPPGLRPWLRHLANAGRLVIFFDGMDEMSRERYGDHTEALSLFAGGTSAKTLFSCRITDFSPGFIHRRLVLLPFDRPRVTEYLKQYILSFPLSIDGHPWTLKALAQRITQGDLPVQAHNPFVLWLLCLYLQEEGRWPVSRVELLRFYIETNYSRKQEELVDDEPPFPPMQAVFAGWARLACQITERNRGVAIPVDLLATDRNESEVREILRVGKRCGVLALSREGHEFLVRFEHHRFQEYFAACHIHATQPEIDWLERLDAPRWQETMLNLILLGDDSGAAQALAGSIGKLTEVCRMAANKENARNARDTAPPLRDEDETLLADRIELCSRILRQASTASGVRDTLMPPFRDAVQLLAEQGNPITQVKMMGVRLNVPEIGRAETVRKPLQSPIHWVRNQALILLASTPMGEMAVGADLATEMGYDLANGLFLSRYKAYRQAVRKAGDPRHRRTLLAGSFCFALNVLLLFAMAIGIYSGTRSLRTVTVDSRPINESITRAVESWPWQRRRPPQPTSVDTAAAAPAQDQTYSLRGYEILGRRGFVAAAAVLLLLAAGATLFLKPSALWAVLPGAATVIAVFGPLALSVWQGSTELARAFVTLSSLFWIPALFLVGLAAVAIHFGSVSLFLAATSRVRRSGHPSSAFLASGWQSCGFGRLFGRRLLSPLVRFLLLLFPGFPILFALIMTADYILPFGRLTNFFLIVGLPLLFACLSPILQMVRGAPKGQALRTFGKGFAILLSISAAACLVSWLLGRWLEGLPPESVARFLVGLIALAFLLAFTPAFARLWHAFASTRPFRMLQTWPTTPGSMTQAAWKARFRNADPHQQHLLLSQTDYQPLSLTPVQFLEVLREIRPLIKEEPALSTYWDRRDQLEQGLRQERQG